MNRILLLSSLIAITPSSSFAREVREYVEHTSVQLAVKSIVTSSETRKENFSRIITACDRVKSILNSRAMLTQNENRAKQVADWISPAQKAVEEQFNLFSGSLAFMNSNLSSEITQDLEKIKNDSADPSQLEDALHRIDELKHYFEMVSAS